MKTKKLASYIFIRNGKAVKDFSDDTLFEGGDVLELAQYYSNNGADELIIFDLSDDDASHEESLLLIKEMSRLIDIPMAGGGNVKRMEDIKKLIYAGCRKAFLNFSKPGNIGLLEEVSKRFGKEKIAVCADSIAELSSNRGLIEEYAGEVLFLADEVHASEACKAANVPVMPVVTHFDVDGILELLRIENVSGVCAKALSEKDSDLMGMKLQAKEQGIPVNTFESSMDWPEFKTNEDGLLPVVVQDYKTLEVLMVAYMNREAYETTIRTGK